MYAASKQAKHRARTLAVAAAAVAVCAGLAGCSTDTNSDRAATAVPSVSLPGGVVLTPSTSWPFAAPTYPSAPPIASTLPGSTTADRSDPTSVAITASQVWFGWDTRTDRSPYAAAVRTTALMTQTCARKLTATPPTGSPDASWTALATVHARARVTAAIGAEERPADTATTAVRLLTVRQTFTGDRPVAPRRVVVVITMTRTPAGWALTDDGTGRCGVVIR